MAYRTLLEPSHLDELFLFRLTRLLAVAGAPVIRWCEGRHNITRREWRLIVALVHHGSMLSSELAERVHLERGPTSKAVSELVQKGLATRTPRRNDRRSVEITLTPEGRAIHDHLFPEVTRLNRKLLEIFAEHELEQLDAYLDRLQRQAEAVFTTDPLPKADRRHGGSTRGRRP